HSLAQTAKHLCVEQVERYGEPLQMVLISGGLVLRGMCGSRVSSREDGLSRVRASVYEFIWGFGLEPNSGPEHCARIESCVIFPTQALATHLFQPMSLPWLRFLIVKL